MRLTIPSPVLPGRRVDVEVEPGVPAGVVRRRLALLTGDARWARPHALLQVAGRALDDAHPAGAPPLLPGAHLDHGQAPDDAARAARTGTHLAVLTGPDAGRLVPLPDGARVRVPLAPGLLGRADAAPRPWSPSAAAHVEVSRRGAHVRARVVGARGTLHSAGAARPRGARVARAVAGVGPRRRAWPCGAHLEVAGTVLALRRPGGARRDRARPWRRVPPWAWTAVASSAGALALAVVLHQPLLLLTAVTGAVGLLGMTGRRTDAQRDVSAPEDAARPAPVPRDVPDLRVATVRRLHDRAGPVPGDDGAWPVDRTLALVGPRDAALGAARALVLRTLGAGTTTRLVLRGTAGVDWRWARWWDPSDRLPSPEDPDVLVVADGTDDVLGAWRATSPDARLVVVVPEGAAVPAWVSTVLRAGGDVARRHGRPPHGRAGSPAAAALAGGRTTGTTAVQDPGPDCPEAVGADVADAQARAAAALTWLLARRDRAGTSTLPAAVSLGELPGVPPPDGAAVGARWTRAADARTLAAPVGVGPGGAPTVVDLVRDGPHALVAGTTGAGKSELLTTLVLALALAHPPRRLALLLVDFKGGTGLGPLAGLPHVVDHVHDLDLVAARRTLEGLHAELRRRERLLGAAGRTDITDLDPADDATPARLLVVVDELRALVDDLPGAAATLARLSAQGRALGVHLVLATQRPAGAVPADLRANTGLRIALRVADDDDSRDVVGTPDAAHLDVAAPGRALVRVGPRAPVPLQVARAQARRTVAPVRLITTTPGPAAVATWRATRAPQDDVATWVTAARAAAAGQAGTGVPWLPALPDHVTTATAGTPAEPDGVLLALADVPDEQRRAVVRWRPDDGPLLVLGGPRSGRSTTLLTVGTHALHAGAHVHAVGLPDAALAHLRAVGPHGVGTTMPLDDVHRALLLLDRLAARRVPDGPADVLLVDGLDALLDSLAAHARGVGADLLSTFLRRPPPGVHTAAAGPVVPAVSRLLGACALRVILPVPDPSLDLQAGVPPSLRGSRRTPGRAVVCGPDGAHVCQVVLPDPRPALAHGARGTVPGAGPVRIGVLPELSVLPRAARVGRAGSSRGGARSSSPAGVLPLGVGGDGPHQVEVEASRPLVVAGPAGSGRTTALRTLALGWAAHGRDVLVITSRPTSPRRGGPSLGGVVELSPDDAPAALDRFATADRRDGSGAPVPVLLVDDLDLVERTAPLLADRLEAAVTAPRGGVPLVAVATTSEHAASGYRGPVAAALRSRQVLVLDPHGPAAVDLLGPGAALHGDPADRPPGRGVLRRDRTLVRVQVHVPGPTPAGVVEPEG